MKDLIETIMNDEELTNEAKALLIERLVEASHGMNETIVPGFYLHTDKKDDKIDMQLWYRNVDP